MGEGSVSQTGKRQPTWKLAQAIASDTQGLVVTGFGHLPNGRALFLELPAGSGPGGGAWLKVLEVVAPVTPAVPPAGDEAVQPRAAALAFTWTGLERLRLPPTALASFARPFREGMMQEDRLRRLGDRRGDEWQDTVIAGGPVWSANTPRRPPVERHVGAYDVAEPCKDKVVKTDLSVHAILLLYTETADDAGQWAAAVREALRPHGIEVVRELELLLDVVGADNVSREHFGFADGLSQPEPFDKDGFVFLDGTKVCEADRVQGVPLGEFLIGYVNGHHESAPGPVVPGDGWGDVGLLPQHEAAQGFKDLGRNGTYMVVRELRQDVAAFWRSMDENAAAIQARDPRHSAHVTAEWLAERVVGRNRDGHLLCPGGYLKADPSGQPDNRFLFHESDPHGVGCPPGSHVRRAHPRDALAPTAKDRQTLLAAANNHRILRRGRKFGPKIADDRTDDGQVRGLLFMCLNTDIARQFEFVQQTWLLNRDFATLSEESDPLVGPRGRMTIREEPLRRTVQVLTYVELAGGDYFFLPSLPAIRYLASL